MNRDDIERIAREADCLHVNLTGDRAMALQRLDRFADLVAAAERQAIADLIAEMRRSIRIVSAVHYATKEVIGEVEIAVLKRGM